MSERRYAIAYSIRRDDILLTLEIRLEYDDVETARAVHTAIGPDNGTYVRSDLLGNTITLRMEAEDAGGMRNTADDLLACVKIAEEASGIVSGSAANLDCDTFFE